MSIEGASAGVRLWRPDGLTGAVIWHADGVTDCDVLFLDRYVFAVTPLDDAEVRYRRWSFAVSSGDVQLLEPGNAYVTRKQRISCTNRAVFLDPAILETAAEELGAGGTPHFRVPLVRDASTRTAFLRFHRSLEDGSPLLEQQTRLSAALRIVLERYAERRPSHAAPDRAAVRLAREYLHEHWSENVSLDDLARAAYTSKFHLVRQFTDQIGLSPFAYLLRLRLSKAMWFLNRGEPISRVAQTCGFSDQSHFSRHFRRVYHVTPGRYRTATVDRASRSAKASHSDRADSATDPCEHRCGQASA